MNLRQLEAFYIVAKRKSFTRAAEELNVTQPAVSMQIKSLEQTLGLKLIQKCGKDFHLTEVGDVLYGYSKMQTVVKTDWPKTRPKRRSDDYKERRKKMRIVRLVHNPMPGWCF